jgi:spermidine/putrescine transport system ATP-binding protein
MSVKAIAVHKSYGTTTALTNVDLTVKPGEFITLLGPSGCGKTTLLRILAGLERPDSGYIHLNGKDITRDRANQRPINTVFQSYALFPHLDVRDNIAFGLRSRRVPEAEIGPRVEKAIALVRLDGMAGRRTHQLSGGQQQRVALARALVNEPQVLLLDEPMSALDANLRVALQLELRALHRRLGGTFVLVTHDQDEALTVSDRIVVMNQGQIIQQGAPQEVYHKPATRFVASFLGHANFIDVQRDPSGLAATAFGRLQPQSPLTQPSATLCIRPEEVIYPVTPACPNRITGTVREVIYRGDHQEVWLDPQGLRFTASGITPLRIGDSIEVGLPSENLRVLYV